MVPKTVRGFEKCSNPLDGSLTTMMLRSFSPKSTHNASSTKGKAVASSTKNAKANKPKETILAARNKNHHMFCIEFIKEMIDVDTVECPYEYVPGKEFLPDFALEKKIDWTT